MASSAAEIKTQGAVEMANDPNSSVTSDDAQRKMVEESKKAGVAAFIFNPDASPEEKAAQARAVSPFIVGLNVHANKLPRIACTRRIPSRT